MKSQPAEELEAAQRRVKLRTLGNIRLIAQLFNQGVVAEKIVHACIGDLLGSPKAAPVEDNAEVCTCLLLLNIAGLVKATALLSWTGTHTWQITACSSPNAILLPTTVS